MKKLKTSKVSLCTGAPARGVAGRIGRGEPPSDSTYVCGVGYIRNICMQT
jgi:hypothetical protein